MPSSRLLPLIVFAQFAGTSLWFAGNAALAANAGSGWLASITSAVQFGFIAGTLLFSLTKIADQYPSPRVFLISSIIAAFSNGLLIFFHSDLFSILILRFITGFMLAGIYPVGMKMVADLFPARLGRALGWLVGALVLGTAFPHGVRWAMNAVDTDGVLLFTTLLAVLGGGLVFAFVPPVKKMQVATTSANVLTAFRVPGLRAAALGYFGHMWELYAFWAFLPLIISAYNHLHGTNLDVSFWSFAIIATGAAGCIAGGSISLCIGSHRVAAGALAISGACCLLFPLTIGFPLIPFLSVMIVWGLAASADSPQFSALSAQSVPPDVKGSVLAIVTSIGFAITIVSIQLLKLCYEWWGPAAIMILAVGPAAGLLFFRKFKPAAPAATIPAVSPSKEC